MGYVLGIDLGTSRTAAAIVRGGQASVVALSDNAMTMPSMVFMRADGPPLIGEPARRRGQQDPTCLAREFKRRFGDETPLVLGPASASPDELSGLVLRHVVELVAEREGGEPDALAVTHPANWGGFRRDLLRRHVQALGLDNVDLVAEPHAAAIDFAASERFPDGGVVAVYDLGGGTFDATVLRRSADGFTQVGEAKGLERLGGIDFDEMIFHHVVDLAGLDDGSLVTADLVAVRRLRDDCRAAKEALSDDEETSVTVRLGGAERHVVLTRPELETMIRPSVAESVRCLRSVIVDSGTTVDAIAAVLLVGGSVRIPLVRQLLDAELHRPIVMTSHPKESVALGAARWAARRVLLPVSPAPRPAVPSPAPVLRAIPHPAPTQPLPARAPARQVATPIPRRSRPRSGSAAIVMLSLLLLAGAAVGTLVLVRRDRNAADEAPPTNAPARDTAARSAQVVEPLRPLGSGEAGELYGRYLALLMSDRFDEAWSLMTPGYQGQFLSDKHPGLTSRQNWERFYRDDILDAEVIRANSVTGSSTRQVVRFVVRFILPAGRQDDTSDVTVIRDPSGRALIADYLFRGKTKL